MTARSKLLAIRASPANPASQSDWNDVMVSVKGPTAAAGIVGGFLDYAVDCGGTRGALLAASGLTEADLADQDARVPLTAFKALIEAAAAATGDGALPIRYSLGTRLEDVSIVGLIVHSSASMADSMRQLNRYSKLMVEIDVMNGAERYSVSPEAGQIWIVDNRPDPNSFPALTETAFARFIGEFRRSFPQAEFALEMEVTHAAPPHAAAYEELYRVPVRFGAARNALRIEPRWLEVKWEGTSRYVFGIFAGKADALLEELARDGSLKARVEARLMAILHEGDISMERMAGEMGMSRQTFYRRLKEDGTTFGAIHDDLRRRMAVDYLSARKVSVNLAAYLVGFSEPSSFVRAFRRWTGQTPSAFRAA
jgi:AraC-like DNA-binding protein